MTHITLSNGLVLQTAMSPKETLATFDEVERDGWIPLEDGKGYYRLSAVISVTEDSALDCVDELDKLANLLFGDE